MANIGILKKKSKHADDQLSCINKAFFKRTFHMRTVKVKSRDIFISDSRIPANIF